MGETLRYQVSTYDTVTGGDLIPMLAPGSTDILSVFKRVYRLKQSLKSKTYSGINPPERGQDVRAPRKKYAKPFSCRIKKSAISD